MQIYIYAHKKCKKNAGKYVKQIYIICNTIFKICYLKRILAEICKTCNKICKTCKKCNEKKNADYALSTLLMLYGASSWLKLTSTSIIMIFPGMLWPGSCNIMQWPPLSYIWIPGKCLLVYTAGIYIPGIYLLYVTFMTMSDI
jgi:hypothetical protein